MEDIIIRNGFIVDGTGEPGFRGDVAISADRIAAIGNLSDLAAQKELDAEGCVIAPGFIDAHAHSDLAFLLDDSGAAKLYQGITTEISGQCGASPFPSLPNHLDEAKPWRCQSFDSFVKQFERAGKKMGVNQAILVGQGALRTGTVGCVDRNVTPEELNTMKMLLHQDLLDGAWGMSLGLEYPPGLFSSTQELSELGKVVQAHDGLITCHLRNEGLKIESAIDELLSIGRESKAHVHISHLKIDNYKVHGNAKRVWEQIERARKEGITVTADVYPFIASSSGLSIRCPAWSKDGGYTAIVRNLNGPRRQEVIEGLRSHYFNAERAETCLFSDTQGLWPEIEGMTLRQVAEDFLHTSDYAEAAAQVLAKTNASVNCVFFVMCEEDMCYFLTRDVCIGSDGLAYSGNPEKVPGKPHPRSYAAIAEFYRRVRDQKLCSIEEAIRRTTSSPAKLLGMQDRGLLKEGLVADITVFDPETFGPRATYMDPIRLSQGVRHVIIGGGVALEDGVQTDYRGGHFLRKQHS